MKRPEIGCFTFTYNQRPDLLDAAVRSCLAAGVDEYILVDDGSDPPVVNVWGDEVRLIRLPENRGIVEAWNTGLHELRSEWCVRCPSDEEMHPGRLDQQWLLHERHGLLCSFTDYDDQHGNVTVAPPGSDDPATVRHRLMTQDNQFYGATCLTPTAVLRAVGGMKPELQWCHDWDLNTEVAQLEDWHYLPLVLHTKGVYDHGHYRQANSQDRNRERAALLRRWRERATR